MDCDGELGRGESDAIGVSNPVCLLRSLCTSHRFEGDGLYSVRDPSQINAALAAEGRLKAFSELPDEQASILPL